METHLKLTYEVSDDVGAAEKYWVATISLKIARKKYKSELKLSCTIQERNFFAQCIFVAINDVF